MAVRRSAQIEALMVAVQAIVRLSSFLEVMGGRDVYDSRRYFM
jgi:hypothetical protein